MRIGIVGGGVFGAASARELALRGHSVELFEAEGIPGPRAAGTDISKAIRLEYGDRSDLYAPLVARAWESWREVERETGMQVLHQTGVLALARTFEPGGFEYESHRLLSGLGYETELLDPDEGERRFPGFAWQKLACAVYNPLGGWLASSLGVEALARSAEAHGAILHRNTPVERVEPGRLYTEAGSFIFDAVLVAAGAWLGRLLPRLSSEVTITRQRMTFYRSRTSTRFAPPVWIHDPADSGWYGFPQNSDGIVKVALHCRSEEVDPDADRGIDAEFLQQSREFVAQWLPGLDPSSPLEGRCCFYTNSAAGDFLIDRLESGLYVAGCGSGHAYKFGPVLGELTAELLESGKARFPRAAAGSANGQTW